MNQAPNLRTFSAVVLLAFPLVACSSGAESQSLEVETTNNAGECEEISSQPSDRQEVQGLAQAASVFLQSLTAEQRASVEYCMGDPEMYTWSNLPPPRSGGISLAELSTSQQALAWQLLNSFLSDEGEKKIRFLATEIEDASGAGPIDAYTVGLFGAPNKDGTWGFQFDGHHVALNFLVQSSNVTLAPAFIGTQPHSVNDYMPMSEEYRLGRQLVASLSDDAKDLALRDGLVRRDVIVGAGRRHVDTNRDFDYSEFAEVGLEISALGDVGMVQVEQLMSAYIGYLDKPFGKDVLDSLIPHLDSGWFVYSMRGQRMYYRIFIPNRLLIEYSDVASDHIHTITRLLGAAPFDDYGGLVNLEGTPRSLDEHYYLAEHHKNP